MTDPDDVTHVAEVLRSEHPDCPRCQHVAAVLEHLAQLVAEREDAIP